MPRVRYYRQVPLHIVTKTGSTTLVGSAFVTKSGDKVKIMTEFEDKSLNPPILADDVLSISVDYYIAKEAIVEQAPHTHIPTQHRDGKEPWCKKCGLNENNEQPQSMFDKKEIN